MQFIYFTIKMLAISSLFGVLGISVREERGMDDATCVGQRAAAGPESAHAFH